MKLSVVIVNYNVRYFLEQTLLSVRKAAAHVATEVFVVDNNSVDDSVSMVREKFPEVQLIANQDNPGFSIANNQAIRIAKGEYVLLLNPDTLVEEDTFAHCVAFMDAHPEAGGLGVRMIDGAGKFLPESKRGFPSPWVAFAKTFGLARVFPSSPHFNHYHLGYLSEHETHEIEVLSGAFMFMRRSALDKVGLLDEAFFMYGEDIDLSYRIVQGGYKNYYLPTTTIIHYKGESTKKGSLNYVKAFYQAMIIFARKHFQGGQARLFVAMLQGAIYLRAGMTLMSNAIRKIYLPLLEGILIYLGLIFLQNFWANYHFQDPDYYEPAVRYVNFPLYVFIWLGSNFFAGAYDEPFRLRRLLRGLVTGTLVLAATYGFLEQEYRSSRALILLGAVWAFGATLMTRMVLYFLRYKSLAIGQEQQRRLVLIGSEEEAARALQLLQQANVRTNLVGRVAPETKEAGTLGILHQLDEIVRIYRIEELIFCSRDLPAQSIMKWMSTLGPKMLYKILPEDSLSIIGSHSKNHSGELYTIDVQFAIAQPLLRRNKRLFDVGMSLFLLLFFPLVSLLVKKPLGLLQNISKVMIGRLSWVGYADATSSKELLPKIKPGVLNPVLPLNIRQPDEATVHRLNLLYAKDYQLWMDLDIVWKGRGELGR
ncbi:glycosyltransferase [Lewinella sp. LCG006]|uniref:glycosyltransferase n=1 Tax=Lewinella sp. LCG006 TaxID=3231911 RepID=UPI003460E417